MKLRKNWIAIFCALILVIYFFISFGKIIAKFNSANVYWQNYRSNCIKIINDEITPDKSEEFIECEIYLNEDNQRGYNAWTNFYYLLAQFVPYYLNSIVYILFFFVVAPAIIWICDTIRDNVFMNYYMRQKNSKFISLLLGKSYRYIWILPLCIFLMFVYGLFFFEFDTPNAISKSLPWELSFVRNKYKFIAIYISQLTLYLGVYINLALIVVRKSKKYFISLLSAFLLFLGIQIFCETLINSVLYKMLKWQWLKYIDLGNIFTYHGLGLYKRILIPLILFAITFLGVIMAYRNKEKLLLDCETKD